MISFLPIKMLTFQLLWAEPCFRHGSMKIREDAWQEQGTRRFIITKGEILSKESGTRTYLVSHQTYSGCRVTWREQGRVGRGEKQYETTGRICSGRRPYIKPERVVRDVLQS